MSDLVNELNFRLKKLDSSLNMLSSAGKDKANTESLYRQELAKKILTERANGVPVTIIGDICRGDRNIAKLKLDRDIADTTYQSIIESINAQKLAIRVIESQLSREWTTNRGGI